MMDRSTAEKFVRDLYVGILMRAPGADELAHWISVVLGGEASDVVLSKFVNCDESIEKRRVPVAFPSGHYYSPVVDPETVGSYVERYKNGLNSTVGIKINPSTMLQFWQQNLENMLNAPFADGRDQARYKYVGDFPPMDATVLYAMILASRPQRIVEIGCGYSTLCMLDAADDAGLPNMKLTCVEPYPARLLGLLTPEDRARITLVEKPVQEVSLEIFSELEAGDILFIDSTHVMKTGSDVHYEFFSIIPELRDGVIIHFHDIAFPFEYPDGFIFERGFSWNEAYALRAFLMYNERFEVAFWGSLLAASCPDEVAKCSAEFLVNPGGSLWIRKTPATAQIAHA